jgi:hypothetical protein
MACKQISEESRKERIRILSSTDSRKCLFVSGHVESLTINIALRSLEGGAATKHRIVTFLPSDRYPPKENMRGLVFELDLGFPR